MSEMHMQEQRPDRSSRKQMDGRKEESKSNSYEASACDSSRIFFTVGTGIAEARARLE